MESTSSEFLQDYVSARSENNAVQFMVGERGGWSLEQTVDDGRSGHGREDAGGQDEGHGRPVHRRDRERPVRAERQRRSLCSPLA